MSFLNTFTGAIKKAVTFDPKQIILNEASKVGVGAARIAKKETINAVKGITTGVSSTLSPALLGKSIYNTTTNGIVNPVPTKFTPQTKPEPRNHDWGTGGGDNARGNANVTPVDIKFNLPPHSWSLPISQNELSGGLSQPTGTSHGMRRARMWCYGYGAIDNTSFSWDQNNTTTSGTVLPSNQNSPLDTKWGFQFLWNPDTLGTALSRNANYTPSAVDKLAAMFGLFTAMEAISFKAVINRVNDFACIRSLDKQANTGRPRQESWSSTTDYNALQTIAEKYYVNGYPSAPNNAETKTDQLDALSRLGTMADIEYIFKMINGEGTNGVVWKNALGRKTADLGFLAPTAVAVQFGPSEDSLSYVGYVDGITITHNMFTEDMIPIHSEVTFNFVAFARTALSQK